jgi:hypothetical protein
MDLDRRTVSSAPCAAVFNVGRKGDTLQLEISWLWIAVIVALIAFA